MNLLKDACQKHRKSRGLPQYTHPFLIQKKNSTRPGTLFFQFFLFWNLLYWFWLHLTVWRPVIWLISQSVPLSFYFPVDQSASHTDDMSVSQSISPTINVLVRLSVKRLVFQVVNWSIRRLIGILVSQLVCQSVGQFAIQSITLSIN